MSYAKLSAPITYCQELKDLQMNVIIQKQFWSIFSPFSYVLYFPYIPSSLHPCSFFLHPFLPSKSSMTRDDFAVPKSYLPSSKPPQIKIIIYLNAEQLFLILCG